VRLLYGRRGPAAKLAAGLVLALALTAAAAFAATRQHGREHRDTPAAPAGTPTIPTAEPGGSVLRITHHPLLISTRSKARFSFLTTTESTTLCRLDSGAFKACLSPVTYRGVTPGAHAFYVQARRRGRTVDRARFSWRRIEPEPFSVSPQLSAVGPLYPGATPTPIPVVLSNPNPVAITVSALQVTASGGAAGCDPATNLALTAPDLSKVGLNIAPHGSVSLPSATVPAPTIQLRELGTDQDACRNSNFDLAFGGTAGR
jgi:hypothetical protein